MILILLLGLCLIGVAVALGFRARVGDNVRGQQTLKHIGAYGFHAAARNGPLAPRERLNRFADALGAIYSRYAREDRERQVLELLRSAGLYRMRPVTFLGYRVIVTMVSVIFWLWLLSVAGATPVEAGVGFTAALQITARRVEGPLGEELRVALSEQNMGLTIQEALANMLGRANSPALRVFVQAILQGETLGVSIGKILRDLAVDMRKRRRQSAEERAQKAPTKIIFPLVLLILPALFIVCVGPILFSFIHGLS